MNVTKDGIEVKAGQIWRDLDKRMRGRICKVKELGYTGQCQTIQAAVLQACAPNGRVISDRVTKVRISRMHKHSTGWELVG